jgi:hypothetical protein
MKTTRQTLIDRMAVEMSVSKRKFPAVNMKHLAEELLDSRNRPYGRQFDQLGYAEHPRKRSRFFSDLMRQALSRGNL